MPRHANSDLAAFYTRSRRPLILDQHERELSRIARRNAVRQREAARRESLTGDLYYIDAATHVLTRVN